MGGWKHVAEARLAEINRLQARISELEDRFMAVNLSEFQAARSIAMPLREPETAYEYMYDETGLSRERVVAENATE